VGVARFFALTALVAVTGSPASVHQRLAYSNDGKIKVYDTVTGRSTVIFQRAAPQVNAGGSPRWSPDGRQIVLAGRDELLLIRPEGPDPRRLIQAIVFPAGWSSDGRWIAYQQLVRGGDTDLRIIRKDGTGMHRISFQSSMNPIWIPGTTRMLVGRARDMTIGTRKGFVHDIVVVGAGAKLTVVPHSRDAENPAVSPNGRWIAFTKSNRIYVERFNGAGFRAVTPPSKKHYDQQPAWSPDGRRLSFTRIYYGEPGTVYDAGIMVVGVDGTGARSLAKQDVASDSDSSWSPDGNFISFQRMDNSGGFGVGLVVVDTRTGHERLVDFVDQDTRPDWAPLAAPRNS
jgi:Tol biopolymer transport system component